MNFFKLRCAFCRKEFVRERKRYNESKKRHWKQYCSKDCQQKSKVKRIKKACGNPLCNKVVICQLNQFKKSKSGKIYCSRSCAALVNNLNHKKRKPKIRICPICNNQFTGKRKYCSSACISESKSVDKSQIIKYIKDFYKKWKRIPLKQEYSHYRRSRTLFGTWNKAIIAAGFIANPVLFARKFVANDGHQCDSLSEKIIDDWLFARKIKHRVKIPYPRDKTLKVDFLIKDYWIEFFGLDGVLKSYNKLKKRKFKIVRKEKLNLISIYPKDLFPKCKLNKVLGFLL